MKRIISILFLSLASVAFAASVNVQTNGIGGPLTSGLSTGANTITVGDGGTITYSGTGAINAKTLQGYTPATLPVGTATQTALNAKATVFTLEQYGGGTGISDNSTAFQAAIDAASAVGGTVQLGEGRYAFRGATSLTVGSSVRIVGRGDKTILDGKYLLASGNGDGGLYYDSYISVRSPVDPGVTTKTFTGALAIGTKSFTLNNVTGLAVGDSVWFQVGLDATDPNEEQLRFIDEITAISGNVITVKTGINETVTANPTNAGTHRCSKLLSVARNVVIEQVALDYLGVGVTVAENVRISDVHIIEATAPFTLAEFDGLTIERVFADYVHGVNGPNSLPWYGWFIQGWGMRGLHVHDVIVKKLECLSFFSCESQSRDVVIDGVQLGVIGTGPQQCVPFACVVDLEQPVSVKNLVINKLDGAILYGSERVFKFENVALNSADGTGYFGLNLADHSGFLRFKNSVYTTHKTVRRVIRPSASSMANYDLGIKGQLASMRVYCSTKTGLTALVHYNGAGTSPDAVSDLVAGAFVEYYAASDIGGPNQFSDDRTVRISTGSSWPATGVIIVEADVLVLPGADGDVPDLVRGSGDPSSSASQIGQTYYDYTNTRMWKAMGVGGGAGDWTPQFTSLVNATLTSPTAINSISVNDSNTSGVTKLMQNGANSLFGSTFGTYSGALMIGSNNGDAVGIVKADLGGDLVIGKGLFGAFTEWMRFKDGNGRIGIGTSSPVSLLDVSGTVTATLFSGPLTGNVTGNVSGTAPAGTLTGTTLSSSVTSSSLTSFGTAPALGDATATSLTTTAVGGTLKVKSGTNALAGTVTLSAGTATLTSTAIDVNTVIIFSEKTAGGTPGIYQPLASVSSGSAVVTSAATDTSTYNWVALKVN